jgi:hypothetical protein
VNRDEIKLVLNGTHKLTRRTAVAMAEALLGVLNECDLEPSDRVAQTFKLGYRTKARAIAETIADVPLP